MIDQGNVLISDFLCKKNTQIGEIVLFKLSRFVIHDGSIYNVLEGFSNGKYDGIIFTVDMIVNHFNSKSENRLIDYTDMIRPFTPMFFFPKNSVLIAIFNRKILICQQAGLITHWYGKYTNVRKRNKQGKIRPLDIPSVLTILKISAFMYFIAFTVFVLEVLSERFECIRNCLDFITY